MKMLVYEPLDVGYCFTLAEIGLHPQSVCAQGPQHLYNQLCCIISKGQANTRGETTYNKSGSSINPAAENK